MAPLPPTEPERLRLMPMTGRWQVRTQSATYRLDLDALTVTRSRRTEPVPAWPAAHLRKDDETLPLQAWSPIGIGESMALVLVVRADGTSTVRTTTPVHSFEKLSPPPHTSTHGPSPVSHLEPGMTGTWAVHDGSSLHILDLDARTYRRAPDSLAIPERSHARWRVEEILLWPCLDGPASFKCSALGRPGLSVVVDTRAVVSIRPWELDSGPAPTPEPPQPARPRVSESDEGARGASS